jgi:hypothetical protein
VDPALLEGQQRGIDSAQSSNSQPLHSAQASAGGHGDAIYRPRVEYNVDEMFATALGTRSAPSKELLDSFAAIDNLDIESWGNHPEQMRAEPAQEIRQYEHVTT